MDRLGGGSERGSDSPIGLREIGVEPSAGRETAARLNSKGSTDARTGPCADRRRLARADAQMHVGVAMPGRVKAVAGGGSSSAAARRATARPTPPEIIYCTAVAEPVGPLPEPPAGRADAKAARHGRPTAAPKR